MTRLGGWTWAVLWLVLCAVAVPKSLASEPDAVSLPELEPAPLRNPSLLATSDYQGSWEYRYGDSPRDIRGVLLWAHDPSLSGWLPLQALKTPPNRNGRQFVWLRTRLEGPLVSDPTLALEIVDQIFEAYLDGQLIYRFGQLDGQDEQARRFLGYPVHYLSLSEGPLSIGDYRGKLLTLRIYSEHINIGVFGQASIGTRALLLTREVRKDAAKVVVGVVLCAVGLFVGMLFLYERSDRGFAFYALFAFSTGLWTLCQIKLRGELTISPLLFAYVELFAFYSAVTSLMLYLERTMGRGPLRLSWLISRLMLIYVAGAALLIATGVVKLLQTLLPFQILLMFTVVYSLILIVHHIYKGDADARLFGLGFTCATMTVAYDVLGAVGIVPRVNLASSHLGQGLFVLMLGLILVRRFRLVHMDLITAKTALLDQVDALASRNAEIELLNAELRHQIEARSRALVDSLIDSDHKGIRANLSFLTSGETINKRYRVIRVLGQGAMGVVYEVERLIDKRHLAAKVLSSHAGRESLARFVREAQLLAHLDHPNLVKITDVDITDQRVAYIVMELVNGTTLAQQHARYRDLSFVLPVLRQVADALAKVHSEGIVHRDLKPANRWVCRRSASIVPWLRVHAQGNCVLKSAS